MNDWLDAEGHADRAFEMFERGRWAEAESELRKALSLNPDQPEWHFNLGLTLEASGRDREALASYERATDLLPDQVDPLVAAGVVACRLGQLDKGIVLLEKALHLDPTNDVAYCNKMEALVRSGNHDEAETTFYMAQQALDAPSPHALAIIAESLMQRGEFARARWCLREALRLEPGLPRVAARLGTAYAAMGMKQRALQLYLRDLRDDPGNIDTLLDYGELLIDLGRLPEAAEKFRRVLELEPANVDAHVRLGQIAMRCKRYEQAHLEFELVLKLDAGFPRVRQMLASALLKRDRPEAARVCLNDEYDSLKAMCASDDVHEKNDSSEHAMVPWSTDDLTHFGGLLMDAALPVLAADVLSMALHDGDLSRPQQADLLRTIALARFQIGDYAGGVACSRRVLRLDPRCIASIHNLALAALQDNRLSVAAGWVNRGLRVNRHDDGLRRLRIRVWMASIAAFGRKLLGRN